MATLNVRPIDAEAASRIKRSARARGMTAGVYLARVSQLHVDLLTGHPELHGLLDSLGLGPVEV